MGRGSGTDPRKRIRLRILLAGVGGQGILTAARILADAAMLEGWRVVVGQLHGMAQRGGSVQATVLLGPGQSSFLANGAADVVVGFEPLEALRARPKMSRRTKVLVNRGRVIPSSLSVRGLDYPDLGGVLAAIRAVAPDLTEVDGPRLAEAAGDARCLNVVMLGALSGAGALPLSEDALREAVARRAPARRRETNRRAFALGRSTSASLRTRFDSLRSLRMSEGG